MPVGVVLFVVVMATFLVTTFASDVSGAPLERNGRYFLTSGGDEREVTKDEWIRSRTEDSRKFSGHLMAFGALAALYLSQPSKRMAREG